MRMLKNGAMKAAGLAVVLMLLILCGAGSVMLGLTKVDWQMVVDAYTRFDGSNEHLIITTARVPRTVVALAVGSSLAVAGALMQALTRNPLASPDLFGLNAGASLAIVLAISMFSVSAMHSFIWIAFLGAASAACAVYTLGSAGLGGLTPLKLTLAGAAMMAMFSSMTHGLLVINERALEDVLFWLAGSVEGRPLDLLAPVLPFLLAGWIGACLSAPALNVLALGEDVAKGLGQRTAYVKLSVWALVVLLAGGSVAVAGPIGFIGIVVPHFARTLVGPDYRWILPYSALLGALLLVVADVGARYVVMPEEVPVGVMTAAIGAPIFVVVARRKGLRTP